MTLMRAYPASLAAINKFAAARGFAAAVLDGFDASKAIEQETDLAVLGEGADIARKHYEWVWTERLAIQSHRLAPAHKDGLRWAVLLALVNRVQEAQDILDRLSDHRDDTEYRKACAIINAMTGRAAEALKLFETLIGRESPDVPAGIAFEVAWQMFSRCETSLTFQFVYEVFIRYPHLILFRSLLIRCYLILGEPEKAESLFGESVDLVENATLYQTRIFNEAYAEFFAISGRKTELFRFVQRGLHRDPSHWRLYHYASECALTLSLNADYAALISAIPASEKSDPEALSIMCRWCLDDNRTADAEDLLDKLRPVSATLFLQCRLWVRMFQQDPESINEAFDACIQGGVPPVGVTTGYTMHIYYYECTISQIEASLPKLETCAGIAHSNAAFWQIYLRCLIAIGSNEKAERLYRSLPRGLAQGGALGPFEMFFQAQQNAHEQARQGWTRFLRKSRHICINAPSSYPTTVKLRYQERPGTILLFLTIHNGIAFLDWFLDHYRALGVDHFFITDNGSADGTFERLCSEPDVSVFSNLESFGKAAFGVLWVNHLMQRFGVGHWCFHVDLDEGFVFPGYGESKSLNNLLAYCEDRGFSGVEAVELDMYPGGLDLPPGAGPFEASKYFDTDYVFIPNEIPPYHMIQGGVRKRLTGLALLMHKLPLVYMSGDVRYIECNHSTTHLEMADVSGALLHYKFARNIDKSIDEAISRREHYFGAVFYRRLKRALKVQADVNRGLLSEYSQSYDGPDCLVRHGLMKTGHFI